MATKEFNAAAGLFSEDTKNRMQNKNSVQKIDIEQLNEFKEHPFKVIDDKEMDELVESIKVNGIINPILVRKKSSNDYEIVSGHRRVHAAKKIGMEDVPAMIREMTDAEAVIAMVDSNLQREDILPSEKAFAYKMRLEAMNSQGQRTSCQVGTKLRSDEELSDEVGDSARNIQRFVRLTKLDKRMLQMVDDNDMALNTGVELSYLKESEQVDLVDLIEDGLKVSFKQATALKETSKMNDIALNKEDIVEMIAPDEKKKEKSVTISFGKLTKFFPEVLSEKEMKEQILEALEMWYMERA